jgi:hypothetical protein
MKAKLKNLLTDKSVSVRSTTDSPDSSYGLECWVDSKGISYGQIQFGAPLGFALSDVMISETDLAVKLGISRQLIAKDREGYAIGDAYKYAPKLVEGEHWKRIGRGVFYSPAGAEEVRRLHQDKK